MPRRRPSEVRDDGPHPYHRLFSAPRATLPSLSPRGVAAVARYENTRHYPGAAAYAWRRWSEWARARSRRCDDADCPTCYRWEPDDAAAWLATLVGAITVMPPRDARRWRRLLRELDDG